MNAVVQTPELNRLDQSDWRLSSVVLALRQSREVSNKVRYRGDVRELPSRAALRDILDRLAAALFPTHYGDHVLSDESIDYFVGSTLSNALSALNEQIRRGLRFNKDAPVLTPEELDARAREITGQFAAELPQIRVKLVSDLFAAYHGDPAASSISEILLCYPGISAIIQYRLAHQIYLQGVPLIARLISGIAHSETGIDIHPGAEIGAGFFIDHGTGVVIGETAVIGENVRLYQAVTLGAKRFDVDQSGALVKGTARHPIIEDNVVIYAGATILGRVTVGRNATIGGNVWLTEDVAPGSIVTQAQMRQSRSGEAVAGSVRA